MPEVGAPCPKDMVYVPEGTYETRKIPALCVDEHEFTNGDFERLTHSFQLWNMNKKGEPFKLMEVGDPLVLWEKYVAMAPDLQRGVAGYFLKPISGLPRLRRPPKELNDPQQPLVGVNGHQAKQLCEVQGKRLPTSRDWTLVASKNGTQKYSTRSGHLDLGVHNDSAHDTPTTRKVCEKRGNYVAYDGKEICDMNGNVGEWTFDPKFNPKTRTDGRFYVSGGYWLEWRAERLRADFRLLSPPLSADNYTGVRCVTEPLNSKK